MELTKAFWNLAEPLGQMLLAPGSTFSLLSLAVALGVGLGFVACRHWRRRGRISPALLRRIVFARRLAAHRSTFADIGMFLLNTLVVGGLIGWAFLSANGIGTYVSTGLHNSFGPMPRFAAPEYMVRGCTTLLLFVAYEFAYWLDHYLSHRVAFLWALHKPHHSAEVLTPWTVWRVHPLDSIVFGNIMAVVIGMAAGFATWLLGRETPIYALDGTNALLVFFVYAYVHLQHSQFWIAFTGPLGRVAMSPAHHQIHHSTDPAHFNRNFGSCLSLFDWLFGTLAMPPKTSPRLKFGVAPNGQDPHSISQLLMAPVTEALSVFAQAGRRGAWPAERWITRHRQRHPERRPPVVGATGIEPVTPPV